MIVAIEGIITKKDPTYCILKLLNGISHGIIVSLNCSANLQKGQKVEFLITQIIREDANLLYGFLDNSEKKMFETLMKVSGIGANTAMAVCSSLNSDDFVKAICDNNVSLLTSVPGIGTKTARKIIAELADSKMFDLQDTKGYKAEAVLALESLGFKKDKINKVLLDCSSTSTAELVKEALKKMM